MTGRGELNARKWPFGNVVQEGAEKGYFWTNKEQGGNSSRRGFPDFGKSVRLAWEGCMTVRVSYKMGGVWPCLLGGIQRYQLGEVLKVSFLSSGLRRARSTATQ